MSEEVEKLFHRRILAVANTFGEQIALTDCETGENLTFGDLRRKSVQLAAILHGQFQIGQGDFLLCLLPNSINYPLILLAGALLGAPISGAPPDSSADELEIFMAKTQCRAIFATNNAPHLDWLQSKTKMLDIRLFLLDKLADQPGIDFNGLLDLGGEMDDHQIMEFLAKSPDNSLNLDATFVAPMSSGASGIPKVVLQTHRNYIAATDILKRAVFDELTEEGGGRRSTIAAQPFHHASGLWILFYCLLTGHRSLVMRKFNPTLYLGLIEEYKIDTLSLGPWLISLLLKQNLANYNLSSIRHIISGGSSEATNAVQNAKFLSNFPEAKNFLIGYGMTEIVLISHMTPLNMDKNDGRRLHSVGKLLPGFNYKIVDCLNGDDVTGQLDARGELWLHSECIMAGYLNELDELNQNTIDNDGWFRTGDVLWEDKDGFFFYVDRLANLILVNGQAVWPAELTIILVESGKSKGPIRENDDLPSLGIIRFGQVLRTEPKFDGQFPVLKNCRPEKDILLLPYSSGTTGSPKGVMNSHRNLGTMLNIFIDHFRRHLLAYIHPPFVECRERELLLLPFFHCYGLGMLCHCLLVGSTGLIMAGWEPILFCRTVQNFKIRVLKIVPPILLFLAKSPIVSEFDLTNVHIIFSGAAPAGADLCEELKRRHPTIQHIAQGYGMTEMTVATHLPVLDKERHESTGKLAANLEMKILDVETGEEVERGMPGELYVRGPTVMLGYLGRPEETAKMIDAEGWLRTGDIVFLDAEGFIHVIDRLKELIKVNGLQVAPAELEDLLLSHSDIQDCAVIGVPDANAGELPRAFVVPKSGSALTTEEVQQFVKAKVVYYKQLKGGVQFVDAIPKSPSGKILRRLLRDRVRKEKEEINQNKTSKL